MPAEFRLLIDSSPLMIWLSDTDNRCVYFNRTWLQFTGRPLASEVGEGWLDGVHPEDRERCRQADQHGFDSRTDFCLEYRLRRHDGVYRWIRDQCTSRRDSRGRFTGYFGSCTDVTELRDAAQTLRRSEERFRLAVEAVDGIVYEFDIRSGMVARTGRLLHRLGYGETLEGTADAWLRLVHPEDRWRVDERHEVLMRGDSDTAQTEYRMRDARGTYHHVLDRVLVMRDTAGTPVRMIGCSLDITPLKQAEDRILELNAELERRVVDRTAALLTANQELEAFTYSVSHDLRAPLRHIAGFTDLLRARLRDPDPLAQRYLETIIGATTRMAEMIDKLLALSRVGRGEMRPVAIDLGELVGEVREELAPTLDGRAVEWRIGDLPVVRADRALLRGALQNLLANAVKFTAGRNPAVIEVAAGGDAREHEIVVRDNGAGFDMKYVDKLFGVFQRLHAPGEFEGTGIGLASVRRIISRHGGRVWAEGRPDAGAEFHFTLPAKEV